MESLPDDSRDNVDGSKNLNHHARDGVPPPIAIVGMAARLPGGVNSTEKLWDFLINKKSGVCEVPSTRYNIDGFYSDSLPYSVTARKGYFLEEDIALVDTSLFNEMLSDSVGLTDPQQRLMLEVVWECLENAGQTNDYRGKDIGCYAGVFGGDWYELCSKDHQQANRVYVTAVGNFALASWVSWNFDLRGPAMTIETGCSSAMVGLHEACQALYSGDCSAAIVAGTSLIFSPTLQSHVADGGAMSTSGICKTFDASADGYGRGEAVNAILIKRLDDAIRDGDSVRAVIQATSVNNDGKTTNISAPSGEAQEALIHKAYHKAGIKDLQRTGFFECHGTGTIAGDTVETGAVARTFPGGIYIGSVKANFGHSEGASGITSIIKAVLALEKRIIPPNVQFTTPNPRIPFEEAGLIVPVESTPWPKDRDERASVNNFGVGGTNVHVILESANSLRVPVENNASSEDGKRRLIVCSARSKESLQRRIEDVLEYCQRNPHRLHDIAYTLALRREHMLHRAFAISEGAELRESDVKQSTNSESPRKIVFVFTGQGAQWAGMGRGLWERFPVFQQSIQKLDIELQKLPDGPSWTLQEELLSIDNPTRLADADLAQPLSCAVQIGIVDILKSWAITPEVVVGHSSGEIAAAYAAGALTAGVAVANAYYRGKIVHSSTRRGRMAAVGLSPQEVVPYLRDGLVVACENSPSNVTLSGDEEAVKAAMAEIEQSHPDTICRLLRVVRAYHSPHMQDISAQYAQAIESQTTQSQSIIPFFSTVTGEPILRSEPLDSDYWRQNLQSPVLFSTAIKKVLESSEEGQGNLFVEIGPHAALAGPLRQILRAFGEKNADTESVYIPSLTRNEDQETALLRTAGNLHIHGANVDFSAINGRGKLLTDMAPYPWNHSVRKWDESRIVQAWRTRGTPHHELLGSRTLESSDLEPAWRNVLTLTDVSWIDEHRVQGKCLFPGAGYLAMAGEAVQQLRSGNGYHVREMVLKAGLFIEEDDTVELITSLKPVRLSDMADSEEWFEFSIVSVVDNTHTKHCWGQIRAVADVPQKAQPVEPYPRHVPAKPWYQALRRAGLVYGRRFQGLQNITADPSNCRASATISKNIEAPSRYAVHPIFLDECLQLLSVAMCKGLARNLTAKCIPALFEDVYVGSMESDIVVHAKTGPREGNHITGETTASAADGRLALSIQRALLFVIEESPPAPTNAVAARWVWKPAVEFLPPTCVWSPAGKLDVEMEMGHQLAYVVGAETAARIAHLEPSEKYLEHYKKLVAKLGAEADRARSELAVLTARAGIPMSDGATTSNQALLVDVKEIWLPHFTQFSAGVKCTLKLLDNCVDIFQGKCSGLSLLMEDNLIADTYRTLSQYDAQTGEFIARLGHSHPSLRVLEVGAGTGATTEVILPLLHTPDGVRLYSEYTFTDVSSGFLGPAKETFARYSGVNYSVFDVTKDPVAQGFELGSYDLIIAANVLHATPVLHDTLRNVWALLAPGGRLFLQELSNNCLILDYICGVLLGWWAGENDGRAERPYIPVDRWKKELGNANFTDFDFLSYQVAGRIASMVTRRPPVDPPSESVGLLVSNGGFGWGAQVEQAFKEHKFQVNLYSLDNLPPKSESVICLLEVDSPFLHGMTAERFEKLKNIVLGREDSLTVWVTRTTQISSEDPRYGLAQGFIRSMQRETGSRLFGIVEVDTFNQRSADAIRQVYTKMTQQSLQGTRRIDGEYAIQDGLVYIPRLYPLTVSDELKEERENRVGPKQLVLDQIGLMDSFGWTTVPAVAPGPTEVVLDVKCVGLNFHDVAVAHGILGTPAEIGLEGSGVIQAVGCSVSQFTLGQRVLFVSPGCCRTSITIPANRVFPIPDSWSFEDAASVPGVYITVIYCLDIIGQLKKGQSVLIHSACGGVGLAAIAICKARGAEIYTTVGNEEKVKHLMDTYDIPRSRIFHSRDVSFYSDVMRETNNRGVDIVLNSLAGELLHASWNCVAPWGKMIEIGKRDILTHAVLPMHQFQQGRSFIAVDLSELAQVEEEYDPLLNAVQDLIDKGEVTPIRPITTFDASQADGAFKYMQGGQHMGKIVIRMPEQSATLPVLQLQRPIHFSPEYSYILSGGLGGVGRSISNWMVEHGARYLTYLSPTAGQSEDHQIFLQELKAQGCHVVTVQGRSEVMSDVEAAVAQSAKPVRGVLQLALHLHDASLEDMTFSEWIECYSCKAEGAWNLHRALQDTPLDFFVMFGSLVGIMGNPGQSNYAAANTFLAALVRHRLSHGQAASIIDLGGMADVGYVSRNPEVFQRLGIQEDSVLRDYDLLEALQAAIQEGSSSPSNSSPQSQYINSGQLVLGIPQFSSSARTLVDSRLDVVINKQSSTSKQETSDDTDIANFVLEVDANPAILDEPSTEEFIIRKVGAAINPTKEMDIKALGALRIDSLVAIELKAWLRRRLGVEVALTDITKAETVKNFAAMAIDRLRLHYTAA